MYTSGSFFSAGSAMARGGTIPQAGLYWENWMGPPIRGPGRVGPIEGQAEAQPYTFDKPGRGSATDEFMTRFGLKAIAKRNDNVLDMLTRPAYAIQEINREYYVMSSQLWEHYNTYYNQLLEQGIPKGYAQQASDEFILPIIDAQLKILELKYPYTFGGANGAQGAADEAGRMLFTTRGQGAQSLAATQHINRVIGGNVFGNGKKKKKNKHGMVASGANAIGS